MERRDTSSTMTKKLTAIALWNGGQFLSQFSAKFDGLVETWARQFLHELSSDIGAEEVADLIQYSKESKVIAVQDLDSVYCFSYYLKDDLLLLYFVVADQVDSYPS